MEPLPLPLKPPVRLTSKQLDCASLRAVGWGIQKISKKLHMSEQNVRNHLREVYRKMGIKKGKGDMWGRIAELRIKLDTKVDKSEYRPSSEPPPIIFTREEMNC